MKRDYDQEEIIRAVLSGFRRYVLYGMSPKESRPSYFVGTYFHRNRFDFTCVNPRLKEIFGRPCFPDLQSVRPRPEVVVVFRRSEETPAVAHEAVACGVRALWLQYGIRNEETRRIAEAAGLFYVEDRCVKVEHARFFGKMHLTGMNTGLISSRKRISRA